MKALIDVFKSEKYQGCPTKDKKLNVYCGSRLGMKIEFTFV
jgi:hypothetical protein